MTADFDANRIDLAREEDFRLGEILVRPSTRQVEANGESQTLQPRIMQVLVALARRQGQVVSRDELTLTCWEGRAVGEDAINRCIQQIRKLGETTNAFEVETIPRVGYRLHAGDAAGAKSALARQPAKVHRLARLGLIATLVAAALAGYLAIRNSKSVEVQAAVLTFAVLGFDALDDDPETRKLAGVIPLEIANALTRAQVSVVPTAASTKLRGEQKVEAARLLKARILIDGDAARQNNTVRIGLRAYHAESGMTVWSTTVDFDPREPGVAERIAGMVARTLAWSGAVRMLSSSKPDAPRRAQAFFRVIQLSDEGDDLGAMNEARRFRSFAPDEFTANALGAIESMDALPMVPVKDRPDVLQYAREAARDYNGGANRTDNAPVMATLPPYDFERRISLDESSSQAPTGTNPGGPVREYLRSGQLNKAKQAANMGLSPNNESKTALLGKVRVWLTLGNEPEVNKALDRAMQTWRKHPIFRQLRFEADLFLLRNGKEAAADLAWKGDGAIVLENADTRGHLEKIGRALSAGATRREIDEVEQDCGSPSPSYELILLRSCLSAMAILGRLRTAFELADVLYPDIVPEPGEDPDQRWLAAPPTAWDPIDLYMPWMAPLRADPRVVGVFERLGLVSYWRTSGNWPDFCGAGPAEPDAAAVCAKIKGDQPR